MRIVAHPGRPRELIANYSFSYATVRRGEASVTDHRGLVSSALRWHCAACVFRNLISRNLVEFDLHDARATGRPRRLPIAQLADVAANAVGYLGEIR
jgi:hypothetical protein